MRREQSRSPAIDGLLLLNKPRGLTSNQALQRVKRLLGARKAGHTGTLDPAATGMLPLCFGEATKVCAFLLDAEKTYRVSAKLGTATDTGDATGVETAAAAVPSLSADEWAEILLQFRGESMQVPPMYSALKKDGKRLYELARKGQVVEREARPIRIHEIDLLEIAGSRLVFRVRCSKGTYVRALVEDIAVAAGTVAHTAQLHRETVGDFHADEMLDLERAEAVAAEGPEALRGLLLPADRALARLPEVRLESAAGSRFCSGQVLASSPTDIAGLCRVYADGGRFLGVGELDNDGRLAPRRVFRVAERPD